LTILTPLIADGGASMLHFTDKLIAVLGVNAFPTL
jgi:hypothetical protein